MSQIRRATVLALVAAALLLSTAAPAAARLVPGGPLPEPASPVVEAGAASPVWHVVVVAALAAAVVGAGAFVAGRHTRGRPGADAPPPAEVSVMSIG